MESKESAIIDAAHEMFADKGFVKSTMSEIAKAAGVAEGTVYLYFNNKEALAVGVIAGFYDRLTDKARRGVNQLQTTVEKLEFLASHHLNSVIEERRILELLSIVDHRIESYAGSAVYEMNKRYVAVFDSVVREGIWRGEINDEHTAWMLRDMFYGGLDYAMRTILVTERQSEAKQFTKELVRLVTTMPNDVSMSRISSGEQRLGKLARRMEGVVKRMEETLPASEKFSE